MTQGSPVTNKHTLKDKLSRLTYRQACNFLKPNGETLIQKGGYTEIDIDSQVTLNDNQFTLTLADATLSIQLSDHVKQKIYWQCSCENQTCEHIGAAFSIILEEKTPLGLAKPPPEPTPLEPLNEQELIAQALSERQQRADNEKMRVKSENTKQLWSDYWVSNASSGKTYRVALRGWKPGDSFCNCPDFRKNTLGTCKHILHTINKVEKRFPLTTRKRRFRQKNIGLHLRYENSLSLHFLLPNKIPDSVEKILKPFKDKPISDIHKLLKALQKLERIEQEVLIYPDAEEYIQQRLFQRHIANTVAEIRKDPANHPLRTGLLSVPLLPYQMDGVAFAAGAGRAILADEMGLGKTIQGIGVAELLAKEAGISKVLVISPASLKSQWQDEIRRFCHRDSQIVIGNAQSRAAQYQNPTFFTLCNYEQVLRDVGAINQQSWDLIILDEGQRIKNWEAKTTQVIKALTSTFALVLSGTPLENRLDDLYSVVEFIDDRRLGPGFRFYNHHRITDEKGKVLGYKNLSELRDKLSPVLLRRTRASVQQQLPERTTEFIHITPTQQQLDMHQGHRAIVSSVLSKRYITEMDLLRLQKALLMCRMSANSTFLVDKSPPGFSSKLAELDLLLETLSQESDRKIILFSEWTTMLDLIEPILEKHQLAFVRLDGSVSQKNRQALVNRFKNDDKCRLFITTNAGATGLNLQAANTIINVDLPWNPALLEQRIARAHRMGQKRPVQVYILVTKGTLEENLLLTLSTKKELAMAALDPDTDVDQVDFTSGMDELKRRLEILLGVKPDAPIDGLHTPSKTLSTEKQTNIANAGGQMITAAFQFINELLPEQETTEKNLNLSQMLESTLKENLTSSKDGSLQLTINLPDKKALTDLSNTMAKLLLISSQE